MTLIKSISGIRGTIGGIPGNNLTPIDLVKFTSGYSEWVRKTTGKEKNKIVVGRDARISGKMFSDIVSATLIGLGNDVVNIGLATTPTTEIAVTNENADGGIILTASHNPKEWNALKLLNSKGEFLSDKDGKTVLELAENDSFKYAEVDNLGKIIEKNYTDFHIDHILSLKMVDVEKIKEANFKIVVDAVNSVGGIVVPKLLKALGVNEIIELNCEANGLFAHNPEPIPENLQEIRKSVIENNADIGIIVDPDVDRLALVSENGQMFGEEYTLVAVADFILKHSKGNTVSNLSSSRALKDITLKHGGEYSVSAVGEVNVVAEMKRTNAVIGGEGNGGIIYGESHYGRDALIGIGLFLTHLADEKKKMSELKATYPEYFISKNKIQLSQETNVDEILVKIKDKYKTENITDIDGVKIDFEEKWVHLRKSNTEPIIRIYSEAKTMQEAEELAIQIINDAKNIVK